MEFTAGWPGSLASDLVARAPPPSMHRDKKDIPAEPATPIWRSLIIAAFRFLYRHNDFEIPPPTTLYFSNLENASRIAELRKQRL
jgi:hypothetical protein